jgi:monoamine oxidase
MNAPPVEPDWVYGTLYGDGNNISPEKEQILFDINAHVKQKCMSSSKKIQQSDGLESFYTDISNQGLHYAFNKYYGDGSIAVTAAETNKTDHPENVIIIGAGITGLISAFELKKAGHSVTILERQHRVGGRIKTVGDSHFDIDLWADTGAMRLPGEIDADGDVDDPSHYLTYLYAKKFELQHTQFINATDEGYYKFSGESPIKMKKWNEDKKGNCNKHWPGWDTTLPVEKKRDPDYDIGKYFEETIKPVTDQIYKWIEDNPNTAWKKWLDKWSHFSVERFLASSYEEMILKLKKQGQHEGSDDDDLEPLKHLLPWPKQAITGYSTLSYTLPLDVSLVWYLGDDMAQWWGEKMHTYKDGMKMLSEGFLKSTEADLSKSIHFGMEACEINYTESGAIVTCRNTTTNDKTDFHGDKVIITLPVNLMRQLVYSPCLPPEHYRALNSIRVNPLVKTVVQSRTRFWERDGIKGGFTKTDLDIGQLLYPSNPDADVDLSNKRGLLMCYTWRSEPGLHNMEPKAAIAKVVREINEIHPEFQDQFEVGYTQQWSDQTPEGAYCILKPEEYIPIMRLMMYPYKSLYFSGEAFSYANGWIQGAMESGLRSAYQVFAHNEVRYAQ